MIILLPLLCLAPLAQLSVVKYGDNQNVHIDSVVAQAISVSEASLFDARFSDAQTAVRISQFRDYPGYGMKHELALAVQSLRAVGFTNRIRNVGPNDSANFDRLIELLPSAQQVDDKQVRADYYRSLANVCWTLGKSDSAALFEDSAMSLFEEVGDLAKVAELRAGKISRLHVQLSRAGKREETLALIPKYTNEIEFSEAHSKYALSYNTRHVAQIHLTLTHNYQEALRLFKESLALREEIGFRPFLPASYSSLGDVYTKMDMCDSAIEMYLESVKLAEEIGFHRYRTTPLVKIGDCFMDQNNRETALEFYKKAQNVAESIGYPEGAKQAPDKIKATEGD